MDVNSDVLENAILGFLFLTDGFSALDILSVTLCFVENALRLERFTSDKT